MHKVGSRRTELNVLERCIPMTEIGISESDYFLCADQAIVKRFHCKFNTLPDSSKYTPNYHWYLHTNNKDSDQAESTLKKKTTNGFLL